jgi:hypothetical protein
MSFLSWPWDIVTNRVARLLVGFARRYSVVGFAANLLTAHQGRYRSLFVCT